MYDNNSCQSAKIHHYHRLSVHLWIYCPIVIFCSHKHYLDTDFFDNSIVWYCIDVDECASSNGGCEQICINEVGSFQCFCEPGFTLASDDTNCDGNLNK